MVGLAAAALVAAPTALRAWRSLPRGERLRRVAASPFTTLVIVVGGSYLVLSTTRNAGSDFELPMLPAAVLLVIGGAARARPRPAAAAAGLLAVLATVSYLGTSGLLDAIAGPDPRIAMGSAHLPLWDSRGDLLTYSEPTILACPSEGCRRSRTGAAARRYLASWVAPTRVAARELHDYAAAHGYAPVVFFAVQDRMFNTNTIGLYYQLQYGTQLPIGLLQDPGPDSESLAAQLTDPARGRPNLVWTGPRAAGAADFSPLADQAAAERALTDTGFSPVAQIPLPDGRTLTLWWKARGPRAPTSPKV